jgi:hypothetical protein
MRDRRSRRGENGSCCAGDAERFRKVVAGSPLRAKFQSRLTTNLSFVHRLPALGPLASPVRSGLALFRIMDGLPQIWPFGDRDHRRGFLPTPEYKSEMTGMPNKSPVDPRICLYQSIQKGCLLCTSSRPCPPLIVIAMRYAEEMAKASGS